MLEKLIKRFLKKTYTSIYVKGWNALGKGIARDSEHMVYLYEDDTATYRLGVKEKTVH